MADLANNKVLIATNVIRNSGALASVLHNVLLSFSSKSAVINYIFRKSRFTDVHGDVVIFPDRIIKKICQEIKITIEAADQVINEFLLNTICFKRLLNCASLSWNHNIAKLRRKLKVYLHKAYRIAPIFNYKRAVKNSETLIKLMQKRFHFPRFTTQLALIIFVTDANNKNKLFDTPLLQKNLRALCDCSAYAFHRARNLLKISSQGKIEW